MLNFLSTTPKKNNSKRFSSVALPGVHSNKKPIVRYKPEKSNYVKPLIGNVKDKDKDGYVKGFSKFVDDCNDLDFKKHGVVDTVKSWFSPKLTPAPALPSAPKSTSTTSNLPDILKPKPSPFDPKPSKDSGGTYDSSTGTYTDKSGQKYSTPNAPSGSTLTGGGGTSYSPKSSGGTSKSIYQLNQPTSNALTDAMNKPTTQVSYSTKPPTTSIQTSQDLSKLTQQQSSVNPTGYYTQTTDVPKVATPDYYNTTKFEDSKLYADLYKSPTQKNIITNPEEAAKQGLLYGTSIMAKEKTYTPEGKEIIGSVQFEYTPEAIKKITEEKISQMPKSYQVLGDVSKYARPEAPKINYVWGLGGGGTVEREPGTYERIQQKVFPEGETPVEAIAYAPGRMLQTGYTEGREATVNLIGKSLKYSAGDQPYKGGAYQTAEQMVQAGEYIGLMGGAAYGAAAIESGTAGVGLLSKYAGPISKADIVLGISSVSSGTEKLTGKKSIIRSGDISIGNLLNTGIGIAEIGFGGMGIFAGTKTSAELQLAKVKPKITTTVLDVSEELQGKYGKTISISLAEKEIPFASKSSLSTMGTFDENIAKYESMGATDVTTKIFGITSKKKYTPTFSTSKVSGEGSVIVTKNQKIFKKGDEVKTTTERSDLIGGITESKSYPKGKDKSITTKQVYVMEKTPKTIVDTEQGSIDRFGFRTYEPVGKGITESGKVLGKSPVTSEGNIYYVKLKNAVDKSGQIVNGKRTINPDKLKSEVDDVLKDLSTMAQKEKQNVKSAQIQEMVESTPENIKKLESAIASSESAQQAINVVENFKSSITPTMTTLSIDREVSNALGSLMVEGQQEGFTKSGSMSAVLDNTQESSFTRNVVGNTFRDVVADTPATNLFSFDSVSSGTDVTTAQDMAVSQATGQATGQATAQTTQTTQLLTGMGGAFFTSTTGDAPLIPPIPPFSFDDKKNKPGQLIGYDIYLLTKKKNMMPAYSKYNSMPFTKREAINLAAELLDRDVSYSAMLKSVKTNKIKPEKANDYFEKNTDKFDYIEKYSQETDENIIIITEKMDYRTDSRYERLLNYSTKGLFN